MVATQFILFFTGLLIFGAGVYIILVMREGPLFVFRRRKIETHEKIFIILTALGGLGSLSAYYYFGGMPFLYVTGGFFTMFGVALAQPFITFYSPRESPNVEIFIKRDLFDKVLAVTEDVEGLEVGDSRAAFVICKGIEALEGEDKE